MKSFDKKITIIGPNKFKKKFAYRETGIALWRFKALLQHSLQQFLLQYYH